MSPSKSILAVVVPPRLILSRTRARFVRSQQVRDFSGLRCRFLTIRSEAGRAANWATQDISNINHIPNTIEAGGEAAAHAEEILEAAGDIFETWDPLLEKLKIFVTISEKLKTVRPSSIFANYNVFIRAT
jgi:hypothetical protein